MLDIVVNRLLDYPYSLVAVAHLVHRGGLVLKVLVNREEVAHLVENVDGKLVDVGVYVVVGVAEGYGDYLLVVLAVVNH